jgi:hypothetical protein
MANRGERNFSGIYHPKKSWIDIQKANRKERHKTKQLLHSEIDPILNPHHRNGVAEHTPKDEIKSQSRKTSHRYKVIRLSFSKRRKAMRLKKIKSNNRAKELGSRDDILGS